MTVSQYLGQVAPKPLQPANSVLCSRTEAKGRPVLSRLQVQKKVQIQCKIQADRDATRRLEPQNGKKVECKDGMGTTGNGIG